MARMQQIKTGNGDFFFHSLGLELIELYGRKIRVEYDDKCGPVAQ